jgi:predicted amidohydrolase YtcJ
MQLSLALLNGRITTPGGFAEALGIQGDRIIAVGRSEEIKELSSAGTREIDLRGRLTVPGFGDSHIHAVSGGLGILRCQLLGIKTRTETVAAVARYAASLPESAWVLGGGWSMEAFDGGVPGAADLDAVCRGRPAYLPNRDGHTAWVNSRALELAGIDAQTPDPPDGRVERDATGQPNGALHEGAMRLVGRLVPPPSAGELAQALTLAQDYLHRLGITSWQDAAVARSRNGDLTDNYSAYRQAAAAGTLTATVVGAIWWDRDRQLNDQLPEIAGLRDFAGDGPFRATTVKMMLDGVCETFTAAMDEPYLLTPEEQQARGCADHPAGIMFIDPDEVVGAVRALSADGYQVHFHALGDRAVRVALDALAALPPDERAARRHHLAHLQFIRPEDLDRFADLRAAANFQPLWACHSPQIDRLTIPYVGPEREGWIYRIGALHAKGVPLAFGSDWPVSSPDPLQAIHVAVNRRMSPRIGRAGTPETDTPFLPQEAIPVGAALDAYTAGVAYVNHDDTAGRLAEGFRADIAVLNQDLFKIPTLEIGDTSVDITIARGKVVHGSE